MSGTIKLQLHMTTVEITSDYVFDSIFKISEKSKNLNYSTIAKEIVALAVKRGEEGLWDDDWKEITAKYQIPHHVYFYILKRLKDAGILRKSRGKYYVLWTFIDHLGDMSTAMSKYYREIGATRKDTPEVP